MNTRTSKPFAAAIVAIGMLSFSFANQAFAAISDPLADKALVNAIIVVAPASAARAEITDAFIRTITV